MAELPHQKFLTHPPNPSYVQCGLWLTGGLGQRLLRLLLELSSLLRVHMPNPVSLPPSSQKKRVSSAQVLSTLTTYLDTHLIYCEIQDADLERRGAEFLMFYTRATLFGNGQKLDFAILFNFEHVS